MSIILATLVVIAAAVICVITPEMDFEFLLAIVAIFALIIGYIGVQETVKTTQKTARESAFLQMELEGIGIMSSYMTNIFVYYLRWKKFYEGNPAEVENIQKLNADTCAVSEKIKFNSDLIDKYKIFMGEEMREIVSEFASNSNNYISKIGAVVDKAVEEKGYKEENIKKLKDIVESAIENHIIFSEKFDKCVKGLRYEEKSL